MASWHSYQWFILFDWRLNASTTITGLEIAVLPDNLQLDLAVWMVNAVMLIVLQMRMLIDFVEKVMERPQTLLQSYFCFFVKFIWDVLQ